MSHEIKLYGPIGGIFGFTAAELLESIPEGTKEITVRIHSPGGAVGEGLAVYHALRDHPAKVTTVVDGYAASIASVVMLAGDVRQVHRNSIVFVHDPWTTAEGNADELRKVADGLDVHAEALIDIYKQRTGMDEDALREMVAETMFFRGVDAIENGFATEVIDDPEEEAQIAAMLEMDGLAAELKEQKMSHQKTRKEIERDLAAAVDQMQAAQKERDEAVAVVDGLKSEHQAAIDEVRATHDIVVDALKTECADLVAERDALRGEVELERARAEAAETALGESQAARVKAEEDAAKLRQTIQNPAFADASLDSAAVTIAAEADAEADKAEKDAIAAAQAAEPKTLLEQYEAMEPGKPREAFLAEHKREILAEIDGR